MWMSVKHLPIVGLVVRTITFLKEMRMAHECNTGESIALRIRQSGPRAAHELISEQQVQSRLAVIEIKQIGEDRWRIIQLHDHELGPLPELRHVDCRTKQAHPGKAQSRGAISINGWKT